MSLLKSRIGSYYMVKLIKTSNHLHLTIIRFTLAIVIGMHGMQKLIGAFGGHGIAWTMAKFYEWFNIPPYLTAIVIFTESIGMISLLFGFLTRLWSILVIVIMVAAVYLLHYKIGFFMNWYGSNSGEGFEYHVLIIAMCSSLFIWGGGRYSFDYLTYNIIENYN